MSELSLELLLLQVVLPALLEQGHTRMWLKGLVRGWTVGVAWLLNLRSYLLGDVPLQDNVSGLGFLCTVKPVLIGHSKRRPKMGFQDRLSLNVGQKYCRMLKESILQYFSTFFKLQFVFKTFVLSIFEWRLKIGFFHQTM